MPYSSFLDSLAGTILDNPDADITSLIDSDLCPPELKTAFSEDETNLSVLFYAGLLNVKYNGNPCIGSRPIRTKGH